jgi:hypothetical protein
VTVQTLAWKLIDVQDQPEQQLMTIIDRLWRVSRPWSGICFLHNFSPFAYPKHSKGKSIKEKVLQGPG